MIKTLFTGNFKAFDETQSIPIRPITLIFGPNSAGKSSFIHSMALVHEAQRTGHLDIYKTELGGSAIDLGGFRQYVHRIDPGKRVEWGVEIDTAKLQGSLAELLAPGKHVVVNFTIGIKLDNEGRPVSGAEPVVTSYEMLSDGETLLRMSHRPDDTFRLDRFNQDHVVLKEVLKAIVTMTTTTDTISPSDYEGISKAIAALLPDIRVVAGNLFPIGISTMGAKSSADDQPTLFPVSRGNRQEDLANAIRFFLPRILDELIKGLSSVIGDELKKLQYLGPLRSFPQRHLAFSEHEDANWYAGGGYAWDVVRRDDAVRSAVNRWLGSAALKTPYELMVRQLVGIDGLESIFSESLEDIVSDGVGIEFETDTEYTVGGAYPVLRDAGKEARRLQEIIMDSDIEKLKELVLVDRRSNTIVSHRDVGIGITQVLPVLVMAYASQEKIIAMEQPEIHLHPALQAELGDLFIDGAIGEKKNTFILETHSEHLILRILRRIREKRLRPDDIVVLYVEPLPGRGSRIVEIRVDEDGDFIDKWPGGFFEESYHEKFAGR